MTLNDLLRIAFRAGVNAGLKEANGIVNGTQVNIEDDLDAILLLIRAAINKTDLNQEV